MWLGLVALFPEMFSAVSEYGVTGRAVRNGLVQIEHFNPRDYALDKHRTVDDKPYGGGPGMLMKVGPLRAAISAAKEGHGQARVICLTPQGQTLDQQMLRSLSTEESLILVSGRYEGIDERLIESDVDLELSIGDYVLSGGELASMVLIDGLTRLLPGVVGDEESVIRDSFYDGLLDYPQYTRPESIDEEAIASEDGDRKGKSGEVPTVLLSGDHAAIARWRMKQALGRTAERRPDLLASQDLDDEALGLLEDYRREKGIK